MNDKAFQIVVVILLMAIATHQSVDKVVWHALFIGGAIALVLLVGYFALYAMDAMSMDMWIIRFIRVNWIIFAFFGGLLLG